MNICVLDFEPHNTVGFVWICYLLCDIFRRLGYHARVINNFRECGDFDIVFVHLLSFYYYLDEIRWIKDNCKNTTIVLMQEEDIKNNFGYLDKKIMKIMPCSRDGFKPFVEIVDFVVEMSPQLFDSTKIIVGEDKLISMFVGYDSSMTMMDSGVGKDEITWDVFTLASVSDNRRKHYDALNNVGISVFTGVVCSDNGIAYYARQSKVCLNLNSNPIKKGGVFPSYRIFKWMANKAFIISDRYDCYGLDDGKHIVYIDSIPDMVDKVKYYLDHQDEARLIAENAFEHIKNNFNFQSNVESAIKEIMERR